MKKLFTSESVTSGHPDKLCDYISDSILDAYLEKDSFARVACETIASKGEIYVTGEISSTATVDIESIVRAVIKEVGYDDEKLDMDYRKCKIIVNISKQSPDIALGVDKDYGAGDQGTVFGYASLETKEYMPLPISLAHKLAKRLETIRKEKIVDYLRPDGKVQVTVEYENDIPLRIDNIVISAQHKENIDLDIIKKDIKELVIDKIVPNVLLDENTKYYINPTGRFVIGGPLGDSGLTGRKIIVDTYGAMARHGGGAFSGKDPTKIDRSASYMARFIAKNIVANGYAKKCEVFISYAIGVREPVAVYVDTFGTGIISDEELSKKIQENYDLSPKGIIDFLDLQKPIYKKTTNYGHFGKEELAWEKIVKF